MHVLKCHEFCALLNLVKILSLVTFEQTFFIVPIK